MAFGLLRQSTSGHFEGSETRIKDFCNDEIVVLNYVYSKICTIE